MFQALVRCDAFAKQFFEFVTVRVAAPLSACPGGQTMKPLKLVMALPKSARRAHSGGFFEGIS